jgi:hypothetical protein
MLGSITPLGERGRGARWPVTATAYVLGSGLAGATVGLLFGLAGRLLLPPPGPPALWALGVAIAAGWALDRGVAGLGLPSIRRQVNETWLRRYRGWVYGMGFGLQLGAGVVTIVTISAVYLVFVGALLTGSPMDGLLIGAAFGIIRAATIAPAARVRTPGQLATVAAGLARWDRTSRRLASASLVALAVACVGAALL